MSIVGIILVCMFILAIICSLPEIVAYLTSRRQSQNLENTKQIEQNADKTDESLIGKKVIIDDIKCTIIDVDKFGEPCAWISDELPLKIEPPYNWCTREYALSLKFNNGWHIPSYDELLKYNQNKICWTTTYYDSMCYYGNMNDKDFKPKRSVRIIKTI
jgi:hypothetical protein